MSTSRRFSSSAAARARHLRLVTAGDGEYHAPGRGQQLAMSDDDQGEEAKSPETYSVDVFGTTMRIGGPASIEVSAELQHELACEIGHVYGGDFRIESLIAHGGIAEVYHAVPPDDDRHVALRREAGYRGATTCERSRSRWPARSQKRVRHTHRSRWLFGESMQSGKVSRGTA